MKQKRTMRALVILALGSLVFFPFPNLLWLAYRITSIKYPCLNREFGCGANNYGFMVLDWVFFVWIVLSMLWALVIAFSVVLIVKKTKHS